MRLGRVVEQVQREGKRAGFTAESFCGRNPKQFRFVTSRARRLLARNPRRTGKTTGVAGRKLLFALEPPFAPQLYVTLTRLNAKQILWADLLRLNHEHQLGGEANHSELILKMPRGADIVLAGANNEREIAKIRGKRFKGATIDECQSFPERIIQPLVGDVIGPTLLDYQGYMALTGTPGPVLAGYFYEADQGTKSGRFERHHWTLADNIYLPARAQGMSVEAILRQVRDEHGWDVQNPTYRREYLGEWVRDDDALALHYDPARNVCTWHDRAQDGWVYIIAFDIGYEDADAIAVLGWAPGERKLQLVREVVVPRQGITELGEQLKALVDAFRPMKVIGDLGALGKKIAEELRKRWGLSLEPADKTRKAEHIMLLDDGLRTGAFLAPPDSRFAEDCAHLTWDVDAKAAGKLELSTSFHSDIADAVLYGYRLAYHWTEKKPEPPPTIEQQQTAWEEKESERIERMERGPWWDQGGDGFY